MLGRTSEAGPWNKLTQVCGAQMQLTASTRSPGNGRVTHRAQHRTWPILSAQPVFVEERPGPGYLS